MPTYEYLCKTCGHRFETWQKMIDEPLTTCPDCGAQIRRVLFPAGVVFKGSGFYKTDHRDNASLASSAKDDPTTATSESGKTETKVASESNGSSSKPAESSSTPSTPASESKPAATTSAT
ncbi:MAG: zinc ribbon domain-containing protein [Ktedonobacteraceae bacterium]